MRSWFYCTCEGSPSGFVMARRAGAALVPASEADEGGAEAAAFFSFDRFRVLWREGAFLGFRNLRGRMRDGRAASVNVIFRAEAGESDALRRAALAVLGDCAAFETALAGMLAPGGPCGCTLDTAALDAWLARCAAASSLRVLVPPDDPAARLLEGLRRPARRTRSGLRFAVCTAPWPEARQGLPAAPLLRPRRAWTEERFEAVFLGRGALWVAE